MLPKRRNNRLPPLRLAVLLSLSLAAAAAGASEPPGLRCRWTSPNTRKPLELTFNGNPLIVMLPGETLEVTGVSEGGTVTLTLLKDGQPFREEPSLVFTAPEKPGAYYMSLAAEVDGDRRDVSLCVLIPFRGAGKKTGQGYDLSADGQTIGHYRHHSRSGNRKVRANPDSYQPPVWWFRISEMNQDFEVAPGLTVGELVVASEDTGRRHTDMVPVCYPMWEAIYTLRRELAERLGVPGEAMKLISMFRDPSYNRSVGSNAFGRHIYGDAFDFYIDREGDGKASDLNRDGRLDRRDAYPVVALIEDLQAEGAIPMGGIGVYNSVAGDHVVTMHLDMRGHRATWGFLYSAAGKRSEFSWASRRFAGLDRQDEEIAAAQAAKEGRKYSPPRREALP